MYTQRRAPSLAVLIFPVYVVSYIKLNGLLDNCIISKPVFMFNFNFYWFRERISNLHLNEIEQRVIKASIKRPPVFVNSFLIGTVNIFS